MSKKYLQLDDGRKFQRGKVFAYKKAKTLYEVEGYPELLIMHFLDRVTHDDDRTASKHVPDKGRINAQINNALFRLLHGRYTSLSQDVPIKTHYIGLSTLNETECLVYRMAEAVPLEVIVRNWSYGSYAKRHPETSGKKFQTPLCEFTLKDDAKHDPRITRSRIIKRKIATGIEIDHMKDVALAVNHIISDFFLELGIELVDFKLVFGRQSAIIGDPTNLRIIGELSPDVFRLRDQKTGESLDKDLFRQRMPGLAEAYDKVLQRIVDSETNARLERRQAHLSIYEAEKLNH